MKGPEKRIGLSTVSTWTSSTAPNSYCKCIKTAPWLSTETQTE